MFLRYANNTNATFSFHGPPGAEEFPGTLFFLLNQFNFVAKNATISATTLSFG